MNGRLQTSLSVAQGLAMYWRLRSRGQSGLLARLSVEARVAELTTQERQQLHQLLCQYEVPWANLLTAPCV
jgi:hypothetical protein